MVRLKATPRIAPSLRHGAVYGLACGALALFAAWIEHGFAPHSGRFGLAAVSLALLFAGLGGWAVWLLVPRPRSGAFVRNQAVAASLGLSPRELEVLGALAAGSPNKVIARQLGISPNTVKTHLARLFDKLGAATRTEAIARARALDLLP